MLASSSFFGALIATYGVPFLVRRRGWYGTLRITAFGHVLLFPLIALAGYTAQLEGGVERYTAIVLFAVLVCYEIGETSFT
jgi:hypothetical protein